MKKVNLAITSGTLTMVLLLAAVGQSAQLGYGKEANPNLISHFENKVKGLGGTPSVTHICSPTDSTLLTSENKEAMVEHFNAAGPDEVFVVAVGKDAQEDIANYLSENVTNLDKITIVMVSSSYTFGIPSADNCSDAEANVNAAIDTAMTGAPGLYTCTEAGVVNQYEMAS